MSDLDDFCEEAQQHIADADALKAKGLKTPESIAIFARLMWSAGYAEAQHVALKTLKQYKGDRPV